MAKDDEMKYYLIREALLREVLEALGEAVERQNALCDEFGCRCDGVCGRYFLDIINKVENSVHKAAK